MSFIISSVRETGTITYHCSTPESALDKVQDFQRADYSDIEIVDDEAVILESRLITLVRMEQAS